ncbi:MAG: phage holin family protein [Thermoleophilaceae bacterium]
MEPIEEETVARQEAADQPIGELVQQLSNQTATLVRKEIRLAQLELQEKGKRAGIGVGMFGGSGLVALYGLGALIAAAILALSTAVAGWLAALIVAVVLFATAGVLALTGKTQVEQATPPAPERAIQSVQTDIDEVKERAGRS